FTRRAKSRLQALLDETHPTAQVTFEEGVLPFADAVKAMEAFDVFLSSRDARYQKLLSGKVGILIGLRRPIIFIGPPNAAEGKLVERAGAGKAFTFDSDPQAIAAHLQGLWNRKINHQPLVQIDDSIYRAFDMKEQIARITPVLERAMARRA
ncbi:MAG: hypothetical protein ACREJQ_03105, partial [bacterium]